jgi:catechol 2,3-dioxygenase-like lactoylglutathione lyase family enzyme
VDMKIELLPIPVSDVDRAQRFYAEQLGFALDFDHMIGEDTRAVQLTPPGSGCSIALGVGTDAAPGSVQGVQIVVSDIEAVRTSLAERGVDVGAVKHFEDGGWVEGRGGDWNSFVFFEDPDGNGWVLQERPKGS